MPSPKLLVPFALIGLVGTIMAAGPVSAQAPETELAEGYSQFGTVLIKQLAKGRKNVVISPLSVGLAIDMTALGARGVTRVELAKLVANDTKTDDVLLRAAKALIAELAPPDRQAPLPPQGTTIEPPKAAPAPAEAEKLDKSDRKENTEKPQAEVKPTEAAATAPAPVAAEPKPAPQKPQISIANALFFRSGAVKASYREALAEGYGAKLFDQLDLSAINGFVKEKTNGKIPEILKSLPTTTSAVLLNAVYFHAAWAMPFSAEATKPATFHLTAKQKVEIPTMHRTGDLPLIEGKGFRAIKLAYAHSKLSMIVILPETIDGHQKIASAMTGAMITDLTDQLRKARLQPVALAMPRFTAETNVDLAKALRQLGARSAICPGKGNFSGLLEEHAIKGTVCVDKVAHRVFIDVSEKGTEAAAATAVRVTVRSLILGNQPVPFKVDRPFLFLVTDEATGAVLFLGRISDPRAKHS